MAPILAIDYGSRRVGLALSDVRQIIAFPYKTVAYESVDELVKELTSVARDNHVEKIVVGFPVGLKGQRTAQTAEVERFVTTLKRQGALPVVLVDERLSTVEAIRILHEQGKKPSREKHLIDDTAAAIFLQTYLDRQSAS